jgi:hypothetical protein
MDFAVRSVLPPATVLPAARQAVSAVDASIPLGNVATQNLQIADKTAVARDENP